MEGLVCFTRGAAGYPQGQNDRTLILRKFTALRRPAALGARPACHGPRPGRPEASLQREACQRSVWLLSAASRRLRFLLSLANWSKGLCKFSLLHMFKKRVTTMQSLLDPHGRPTSVQALSSPLGRRLSGQGLSRPPLGQLRPVSGAV